jgi:pyruvate decarboxylase
LHNGPHLSHSNTGGFTRNIPDDKVVLLAHDYCQVNGKKYKGMHFLPVLKRIVDELKKDPATYHLPRDGFWTKVEVRNYHIG